MHKRVFIIFFLSFLLPVWAKTVRVGYYKNSGNFMSGFSESDPRSGFAYEYI